MEPAADRPQLRALEFHRRPDGLLLLDPLALCPGPVLVPEQLLPILARLDGTRTLAEIEAGLRAAGLAVPAGFVARLVRDLEESLLLEGPLFETTLERTAAAFAALDFRPARHAGSQGYPDQPAAHRLRLAAWLGGMPAGARRRAAPTALVAPHIDLGRGAAGYAAAYAALAGAETPDLFVVLGTGHAGPTAPLVGLPMDWDTPLGRLRTDRDFVAAVHGRVGSPDPRDLFLHRDEHSLEFQMLWLAQLFGTEATGPRVAGFLCGALPSATGDPDGEGYVERLVGALRDAARGRRVCWIAGADLAHVGPLFGDADPVDGERLARLERDDRARLAQLERGAPGRFHRAVVQDGNPDRICSATALYLVARLAGAPLRLLHYGQAVADDGSQCVSFCAALSGAST
jgi:AmmeMemoRadiSam system protein B